MHRLCNRHMCLFEAKVEIDAHDQFEGTNRLASGVRFLNSSLGYASYIGENSFVKNTAIGRYCCIGPDVSTIVGNHPISTFVSIHPAFYSTKRQAGFTYVSHEKFNEFKFLDINKQISVVIGNDVWLGASTRIMEGIRIGDGAVIAAGSVVTKDVPPYAIVGGVPAKIIKYRFDEKTITKLMELKWWDRSHKWIQDHADDFEDVNKLISKLQIENKDS